MDNAEEIDFSEKYSKQNDAFKSRFDSVGAKFNGKTLDDYVNGKSFCCGDNSLDKIEKNNTQTAENAKFEDNLYFYHPDHLGSTNLITNFDGEVTQSVAYVPYGEVFVEERNGSWSTPFLFNAKELDEETGLYYYGARYLDPMDARWLSVDQKVWDYPGMSPYNYCAGNPIKLIDPDGNALDVFWDLGNVIYDVGAAIYCHSQGRHEEALEHWVDAGADVGCAIVPFVPAGASKVARTGKKVVEGADKAADTQKAVKTADKVSDAGQAAKKTTETAKEAKPYSNSRPSYRKGQVEEVWEKAKDKDGKVYDPNTLEELHWDKSKPRNGQWDMGHTKGNKYEKKHKEYMEGKISKKEFLEWYRNPQNYKPESPSANRSHQYE